MRKNWSRVCIFTFLARIDLIKQFLVLSYSNIIYIHVVFLIKKNGMMFSALLEQEQNSIVSR